jgi:hypothetical protein
VGKINLYSIRSHSTPSFQLYGCACPEMLSHCCIFRAFYSELSCDNSYLNNRCVSLEPREFVDGWGPRSDLQAGQLWPSHN